jgi:hypothetical protein
MAYRDTARNRVITRFPAVLDAFLQERATESNVPALITSEAIIAFAKIFAFGGGAGHKRKHEARTQ